MTERFSNAGASTLSAAITLVGATTLTVTSAASFPTQGNFRILIDSELLLVTGVAGTTFTVTRGIEGTTAATHLNAATVTHILTAGSIQQLVIDHTDLTDPHAGKYPLLSLIPNKGSIFVGTAAGAVIGVAVGNDGQVPIADSAQVSGIRWGASTGATGPTGPAGASGEVPYVCIQDQKASGVDGGTSTSGSWQTRTLNTLVANDQNLAILDRASNFVSLSAGTWRTRLWCPGFNIGSTQARLFNVTGNGVLLYGAGTFIGANGDFASVVTGRFALQARQQVSVEQRCSVTQLTNGFGEATAFGNINVYTIAEFWLEAGPPPFMGPGSSVMALPVRRRRGIDGLQGRSSLNAP